ncbi:MAG TPA: protein-L-isoaspartate(D-aspartate) O-methyltransferase [Melioribacteraceae bacterium]|nr:protein-L-isoaspartate(D-aspartate) O-methyltransferase [Melioribacteraceae bacterium]
MSTYYRELLIEKLKKKGITDEKVLKALFTVDRKEFCIEPMRIHAYEDNALPIGSGQTISQPYTVAVMTEALGIKKGDKVLEIGTGSGYQAAILYELGAKVFTIERQYDLYTETIKLFEKLDLRIAAKWGDGTLGWPDFAPYDGIIVTAGAPSINKNLFKQLNIGGKLVMPIGDRESQEMHIITKLSDKDFKLKKIPNFKFVPLIGMEGWEDK